MPYQWRALLLAVAWLNATLIPLIGVPVLLPAISEEFGTSTSATAWVALAYSLAMAGAFMPASHVGDLLGHKRVALFGSYMEVAFMLAIVFAPNLAVLVALRFGQGIVHSLAVPNFNVFAIGGFPQAQRGRASGLLGGGIGVGMLVVPLFVGLITDGLGWRWVFFIASAITLAITVWGSLTFQEAASQRPRPSLREFDIPGALLLMTAVAPLIIAVQLLRRSDSAAPWLLFAAAAVLLTAFVIMQSRLEFATLPVRLFRRALFAIPAGSNVAVQFANGVGVYLLPIFFIQGLGWTATYTGSVMAAMAVGRPTASVIGGFLADRLGGVPVILIGSSGLVGALVGLATAGASGTLAGLLPFMVLFGVCHSVLSTGLQKQMYGAVPRDQLGMAPGVLGLGRHLGQAIGVGVAAAIFSTFADAGPTGASDGFSAAMLTTAAVVGVTVVGVAIAGRLTRSGREAAEAAEKAVG